MKSDGLLKHALIAFVGAVVLYFGAFAWIQHRREFKGPWEVSFQADAAGAPSLVVSETFLKISQKITFPNEKVAQTNLTKTVPFDQPVVEIPFGKMIYQDPTFLPGAVTINFSRHEIELLPRVLIIDKKEYPWQSGGEIAITEPGRIEPIIPKPK